MKTKNFKTFFLAVILGGLTSCVHEPTIIYESIRPPLDLQITKTASYITLTFNSSNNENEFDGFEIFWATTQSEAEQKTAPDAFCNYIPSGMTKIKIYIGATMPTDGHCAIEKSSPPAAGSFLAVRGHVKRNRQAWSPAAIELVP